VEQKKEREKIERIKKELVEEYEKHLEEIFKSKKDSPLTFDEIENLVDGEMDTARSDIIRKVMENELEEKIHKGIKPEETSICICGTEVTICRDKQGKVKIFERPIQTKRGPVKLKEYGYYCPKCRKIFFPSEKRTKTIQREL